MNISIKYFVIVIFILILPTQSLDAEENQLPERTVLLEMYTGTWCGWCPYGADVVKELEGRYNDFISISYHVNDEMEINQSKELSEIIHPGYPQATIDRVRSNKLNSLAISRDTWEQKIIERRKFTSPISIDLEASYKSDSKEMDIAAIICSYEDFYAELRVNVIVIEDSLNYKQKLPTR